MDHLRDISIWIGVIACWASLLPWVVWSSIFINIGIISIFVISRILFIPKSISYSTLVAILCFIPFCFIYSQLFQIPFSTSLIQSINRLLLPFFILLFSYEEKNIFLKRLINLFSIILVFSIPYFLLHFFIDLPFFIQINSNDGYSPFKNYILFILSSGDVLGWFTRFRSIYTEPGHLALGCSILLYINGYTLKKWQNIIMTIALIWSFSLAGYVLYFGGLVLYTIIKSQNLPRTILKITVGIILFVVIGIEFYSPDNTDIVSVKILSRLDTNESGDINGDSRNSMLFDQYFDKIIETDKKYLGLGKNETLRRFAGTGNSSYKNYIMEGGYIGIVAVMLLMILLWYSFPSRKGLGLMILLMLSFIQRPYFIWAIEILPYICALNKFYTEKVDKKQKVRFDREHYSNY